MVCQPGRRTAGAIAGLVVWLTVATAASHAQVEAEVSDRSLVVGEGFTLVIRLDYEEPDDVVVPEITLPGLRLADGPNIRPITRSAAAGRSRLVEIRLGFVAEQAGRYVIEPIPIRVAGQVFETPPKLVEVSERGSRDRVPFRARWVVPDAPFYAGEGRAVYLEIYNVDDYVYPSEIIVQAPERAIFEEVQGLGMIGQRVVDGVTLFRIPVAVFMLTPSGPGAVQLEPARVDWEGQSATAPRTLVTALAPPQAIETSGAVGSFTLSAVLDADTLAATETTALTLRLEGEGNLHFLELPALRLNGFRVEGEEELQRLSPVDRGYSGYREIRYELRPTGPGASSVQVEPFAYLEWSTGRVFRTQVPEFTVEVTPVKEPVTEEGPAVSFSPMSAVEIVSVEPVNWYRNPLSYGLLVPGLLFLVSRRIWRRHGAATSLVLLAGLLFVSAATDNLPLETIERGLRRYAEGDLTAALHAFESASRAAPESPGIQHNLAILYFQKGDIGRSVYAVREAIRFAPGSSGIRSTALLIERTAGLERTVPPLHLVHPDTLFFALAVAVNLFFVGLSLVQSRHRGVFAIVTILLGVVVAALIVGLAMSVSAHDEQVAVALNHLSLRRIPSSTAESWLELPPGTAVERMGREGGFVLVRSDLGLEGWAPLSDLLWPGNPALGVLRYRAFVM